MEEIQYLKYIYHEDLFIIEETPLEEEISEQTSTNLTDNHQETSIVRDPEAVSYFGKNEKGILILIHDAGSTFLNQNDLDFLMRIVESGLRYSKNDFALVNIAHDPLDQVLAEIQHHYLISFGIEEPSLDNMTMYQLQEKDGVVMLPAHSLSEIALDESKKRQLWEALKSMFDI